MEVSKNSILCLFLIMPFMKMPAFSEVRILSLAFDAWFILAAMLILLKAIHVKYHPSRVVIVNGVFQLYVFLNTFLQSGFSSSVFRNTIGVVFALAVIDMFLCIDKYAVYKNLMFSFAAFMILNILCGNGKIFDTYLFGQRTNLTTIAMPMMVIAVILCASEPWVRGHRGLLCAVGVICVGGLFLILREAVSTALLALGIMAVCYGIFSISVFQRMEKLPSYAVSIGLVIYNFIVVIFQSFGYMKYIFQTLLGESMTLTGRLQIWSNAMMAFLEKPIWGYGYRQLIVSRGAYAIATGYVHNNYLQCCVDGGVIALILFIILLLTSVRFLRFNSSREHRLLLAACVGMGVAMISEALTSYNYYYFFLLLAEFIGEETYYTEIEKA